MTTEQSELLFFDTFSHDTSEELNLDLVQFTKTVCVTEVRIIPLGARVQADFPGGVRLGATNPSQFKIEFFVNDLSKPRASTFESVGGIEYNQNGNIHLVCEQRIPTDGVVLRGWYTTITLAVYGYLTKAIVHENPSPGPLQAQVGPDPPTDWPHSHPQVGELPPGEGYLLEPGRDPYNAGPYREDSYPSPHPEYSGLPHPHPYQEEWPQSAENYDQSLSGTKEVYDGEQLSWEQRTPEDKSSWERKERDRDIRHRGEREFREHSRECSPDYERGRASRSDYHRDYPRGPRAWSGRPRSPPPHPRAGARTPPPPPAPGDSETRTSVSPALHSDHGSVKKEGTSPQVPFESLSPGDVESISEGEIPEAEGEVEGEAVAAEKPSPPTPPAPHSSPPSQAEEQSLDVEPFEPILSDEEIADDSDPQFQDMEYDFGDYPEDLKAFNPYNCELNPLVLMSDPAEGGNVGDKLRKPPAVCKLCDIFTSTTLDFSTSAAKEDWVHAAEKVVSLLPVELLHVPDFNGTVNTIISWVKIGLDFDSALNQPQPGYKLRHIKVGVRLVEVVCNINEEITEKLFAQINVHQKLIELFHKEYMALSIKLMILRSLDASLRYKSAVESFLKSEGWNGYQKLLELVQSKQLARVSFALTSVLQKISFYELLDNLNKTVAKIVKEKKVNESPEETDLDVETVTNSLEEIIYVYDDASKLISQPKRFLPVSAQFEIGPSLSNPDPYPALFTYFRTHKLLETLLILLTHPGTSSYSSVVIPIREILTSLQQTQDGLRFLLGEPKTINSLVRVLLGGSPVAEEAEDSASEQNSQLGLHLVYRLQALSHVDSLLKCYHEEKTDPNHPDVIEHLQALFCLTFGVIGKMAVVHVLSRGEHIAVLLKYFKENITEKDTKGKKSPGKSYIADLITMTVKLSDHVPFLQKYGKELLDIIAKDKTQDLTDLTSWLKPVESPNIFAYDDISVLVEILKKNIENCTTIPGEMITAVRLLKYLGIPPKGKELTVHNPDCFEYIELKYKCVIIQLFSLDGIAHLSAMIQKLCENYEQPTLHSARLVGRQGLALISFLHPAIQLVRRVLTQVIKCRNTEFKDLTLIPTLLQTYSLMQAVPLNAQCHHNTQKICRNIVETLLAYTQPVSTDPSSETEALNKSLWTLMMTEVFKYTVFTPNNFLPGLSLLAEMLPLPLQVQTRSGLASDEISRVEHARKLWSAHLHCLSSLIHEVISTISTSCCSPALQLLRSVCVQLADLAAPTALTVTRAVLDCIVSAVTPPERPVTSDLMRLLTFLACLVTHASIKAALIHLVTRHANADKAHQRYPDLIVSLCHMLRVAHDSPTHVQAQECILSVVQSLCHCELSLIPPPGVAAAAGGGEMYLANTLPPRDLLGTLILVMLEHVSNPKHNFTTLQPVLRTFLMLTEHDYGFFHLNNCLEKKPEGLWNVVSKVVSVWTTERAECRDMLNILLELLRNCLTPDTPDEVLGLPARTLTMTAPELAHMLGWQKHSEDNKHPLYAIDNLLQESRSEDETLETLCESVTELIRLLEEEGSKPIEPKEVSEPLLPSPDPLLAQFSARPVFVVGEVDDDRLTASYWLTVPLPDDQDSDMQQVKCDLMEVARQELPDLALAENVATLCRHKAAPGDLEHANPEHRKKRASNLATDNNQRRPFVAPMRGRGFRGSVQRGDMFRSRPPNTSRPPSLHVDDFVALETCGQQPTGPTGYNKMSMRVAQDMIATRVRGRPRPFGIDRGGRFFPTPYSRRENGREGLWHGDVSSNGSSGPSTGSFRAPPPDMRGAPHFSPRPQLRGPLPMAPWPAKDGRERFSSPSMRGGPPHHNEPNRHVRFFSR